MTAPRLALVTAFVVAVGIAPASAANREHQQLAADIRMLQEQNGQLQAAIVQLAETLTAISGRLEAQADLQRKGFADQKVLIDSVAGELRVVREKLDDTSVRLSSLGQEVEALRLAIPAVPAGPVSGMTPPPDQGAPVDPSAAASGEATAQAAQPPAPAVAGLSPQRLFDQAKADYASGQWALAIGGFETYVKSFPRTEQADDAQFYIGESYSWDGKFDQAVAAYDRVIQDYPGGDQVAAAYYKRGLALVRLGREDEARESLQAVVEKFPNSDVAPLARQRLERLGRPEQE